MQLRKLGRSALKVALCLGGNVFGWTADEAASFAVLRSMTPEVCCRRHRAIERGQRLSLPVPIREEPGLALHGPIQTHLLSFAEGIESLGAEFAADAAWRIPPNGAASLSVRGALIQKVPAFAKRMGNGLVPALYWHLGAHRATHVI